MSTSSLRLSALSVLLVACATNDPKSVETPRDLSVPPLSPAAASASASAPAAPPASHPATREDCTAIVDANVEVKLREMGVDEATFETRKAEMRRALVADIDQCVGRKVTDAMLACVRAAKTSQSIDACFH